MRIDVRTEPFTYLTIENLISKQDQDFLYNICEEACLPHEESINDLSFFVLEQDKHKLDTHGIEWCKNNSVVMNNVGVPLKEGSAEEKRWWDISHNMKVKLQSSSVVRHFPLKTNERGPCEWGMGLTITSDYREHPLTPHTDDPTEIREYALANGLPTTSGIYKGVAFLTKDGIDYTDYGTRFYKTKEYSSEIEEIPFVGGNSCFFVAGPNSYHGTHFPNGLPNKRFSISLEYY